MRGDSEIRTTAREAKCMRLIRFEHPIGLLELTTGSLVEVGYVAEQVYLQYRDSEQQKKNREEYIHTRGSYIFFSSADP